MYCVVWWCHRIEAPPGHLGSRHSRSRVRRLSTLSDVTDPGSELCALKPSAHRVCLAQYLVHPRSVDACLSRPSARQGFLKSVREATVDGGLPRSPDSFRLFILEDAAEKCLEELRLPHDGPSLALQEAEGVPA